MPTNDIGYMASYMRGYNRKQPLISCSICGKSFKKHKKSTHYKSKFHLHCEELIKNKQLEVEKNQNIEELKQRLNDLEKLMNERLNERK
jgi:hypothetical protein